eukprot:Em0009g1283a
MGTPRQAKVILLRASFSLAGGRVTGSKESARSWSSKSWSSRVLNRESSRGTHWAGAAECSGLTFNRWYLDDDILAGPKSAINHAIHLIQLEGPPLGLRINTAKCELYSSSNLEGLPVDIKRFNEPNMEIQGASVGDIIFCAKFMAQKRARAARLLTQLTPKLPSSCAIVHPFANSEQAQLSLSWGDLGLRKLALHCSAAFLASVNKAGCTTPPDEFTAHTIAIFNSLVPPAYSISMESLQTSTVRQKDLSARIEDHQFDQLFLAATPANHARLLSVASCHASSWFSVIPARGLNLHMDPAEFQVALKWWLGVDTSPHLRCPHCPDHQLDPLGHHALMCWGGGDAVLHHNSLCDVVAQFCHTGWSTRVQLPLGQGKDFCGMVDLVAMDILAWAPGSDGLEYSRTPLVPLSAAGDERGDLRCLGEPLKDPSLQFEQTTLGRNSPSKMSASRTAPIGLDSQWNANPPQGPALGVVGDVFAHLGHPSCRTTMTFASKEIGLSGEVTVISKAAGDIKTKDKSVFPLKPDGPCLGFEQVLKYYTSVAKEIQLSGPTNFAPLIKKAIEIVKKEQSVTNEVPTRVAIVEASKYPLSIVVVGVGDGPWDQMDEFDDSLPERAFDNFQFVDYNKSAAAKDPDIHFAVAALMEIPDQFLANASDMVPFLSQRRWKAGYEGDLFVGMEPFALVVGFCAIIATIIYFLVTNNLRSSGRTSSSTKPTSPTSSSVTVGSQKDTATKAAVAKQSNADKFTTLIEVSTALNRAGLETSNLIIGVDFTASNETQGTRSFGGRSLHSLDPQLLNPYQKVITIVGKTLERFDEDHLIPAFGFGDIKTKDKSVFPLKPDGPCLGFEQVLKYYTSVAKEIQLSGPTNFAPLIKKAIEIVKKEQSYHILVIIADGQVTNEVPTRAAIVEASKYPLSIVVVGVGDGPWDQMDEFDDSLPERAFDNFQFVDYNKSAAAKDPDIDFAVRALMEIPDQFLAVRKLGLL